LSYTVGYATQGLSMSNQIRILYILPAVGAGLQCFLQTQVFFHESPKYLMQKGMLKEVSTF
jgi:hypothetical protein